MLPYGLEVHRLAETLGEWKTKNLKPRKTEIIKYVFICGQCLWIMFQEHNNIFFWRERQNEIGVEKYVICINFIISVYLI